MLQRLQAAVDGCVWSSNTNKRFVQFSEVAMIDHVRCTYRVKHVQQGEIFIFIEQGEVF